VFPRAETPDPEMGILHGETAVATFTASTPGRYPLIFGFPRHALLGMYALFTVSASSSTAPSMTIVR
jgi:hypothetical protein